jgi:hypothetical protein
MQVLLLPTTLNCHKSILGMKLYGAVRIELEVEILLERTSMLCFTYISCVVITPFILATKIILNKSTLIRFQQIQHNV